MLKFEKVCEREFFELLKGLSFKCVRESSLPLLQVSSQIQVCARKFFKCLRVSCKGFVL
jgi:hypothetical protein